MTIPESRERLPQNATEWTADMVETLLAHTAAGKSSREVAALMNSKFQINLTRNALIGKLARLKAKDPNCVIRPMLVREVKIPDNKRVPIKRLRSPIKVANGTTSLAPMYNGPPVPPRKVPDDKFTPLSNSNPMSILDLRRDHCRWPVGEDRYCCETVVTIPNKTSVYCRTHRGVAYYRA